jgi:transposase-like protein
MDNPRTLLEAVKHFANPDNCLEYLMARRWPNGIVRCPGCNSTHVRFDRKRRVWTCNTKHERRQFSIKVGTIFEDSPLGLDKWLPTVWMIANCKNGVSSWEIHRAIGVTQKTAWFMLQRIRLAMQDEHDGGKLSGDVEVDETYIGAKARNMHKSKRERLDVGMNNPMVGKVAVMGLLERHVGGGSKVRTVVLPGRRAQHFQPEVKANIESGATIHTDAHHSYRGLNREYVHNVIDHAEKYVDGNIHTNGCENFWSLLKRALHGTYVAVEPFHLFRYLDEQAFRFNNRREMTDADRFSRVISNIVGRRLTYKELIGALDPAVAV